MKRLRQLQDRESFRIVDLCCMFLGKAAATAWIEKSDWPDIEPVSTTAFIGIGDA